MASYYRFQCVLANVDADAKKNEALAKKYGVGSFPTIIFFSKDNKEGEHYEGGRDEEDLVNFMNEKCGTYRAVGGGLNDKVLTKNLLIFYDILKWYYSGWPSSRAGCNCFQIPLSSCGYPDLSN